MQGNPIAQDRRWFRLQQEAARLGFLACGMAKAEVLAEEARDLESWLKSGRHGQLAYMERNFDLRIDPTALLPGARTVLTTLSNYWPRSTPAVSLKAPKISRYAVGIDYHHVIRQRLQELHAWIQSEVGHCAARICVDSAPFMDKAWAVRCGLGWIGKHTNLLRAGTGSWFFIGSLVLDVDLSPPVVRAADRCGTCTRCIDACPTQALTPYRIDATRCISYWTIETPDEAPSELSQKFAGWAFGCDICQEVCPWNRFSTDHQEPLFEVMPEIEELHRDEKAFGTTSQFNKRLRRSPLSRIQRDKWLRNRLRAMAVHSG